MPVSTNSPKWAFAPTFSRWCIALCFSLLAAAAAPLWAQAQIAHEFSPGDSLSVHYFGNGKPRIITPFRQGLAHGPSFEYHASGQINFITHFYDGEKSGEQKMFDQAGRLMWVKTWQANRMHGEERLYYTDGQIQSRIDWRNNQKHGNATFYFEQGGIAAELRYEFGTQISATYYDEEGKVKTQKLD
jgi:antitoxin component YwqK of YwqJK toxin-antitoxin module